METRTKRMRKIKTTNRRKLNRNKVLHEALKKLTEIAVEQEELLNDREEYNIR
jgi:hypothetical protein